MTTAVKISKTAKTALMQKSTENVYFMAFFSCFRTKNEKNEPKILADAANTETSSSVRYTKAYVNIAPPEIMSSPAELSAKMTEIPSFIAVTDEKNAITERKILIFSFLTIQTSFEEKLIYTHMSRFQRKFSARR